MMKALSRGYFCASDSCFSPISQVYYFFGSLFQYLVYTKYNVQRTRLRRREISLSGKLERQISLSQISKRCKIRTGLCRSFVIREILKQSFLKTLNLVWYISMPNGGDTSLCILTYCKILNN